MFKRKRYALLFSPDTATYPEVCRVAYTIEGPGRWRLTSLVGDRVLVLHDNGEVTGSITYGRWEQL